MSSPPTTQPDWSRPFEVAAQQDRLFTAAMIKMALEHLRSFEWAWFTLEEQER